MSTQPLLIEIGSEELPPKLIQQLSDALSKNIKAGLARAGIEHGVDKIYGSPRRIAVQIDDVAATQKTQLIEKRGPALKAAFDNEGNPTLACLSFVNACGGTLDQITTEETEKGAWIFFRKELPGKPSATLIPEIVNQALQQLPINKPMRWGSHSWEFVRPVHWVLMLLGEQAITSEILGQISSQQSRGHRFLNPAPLFIPRPQDYEQLLAKQGFVIADFNQRKAIISQQITDIVADKGQALMDDNLLNEVTGLVEWPVALLATFDPKYLEVPAEALISAMRNHQKCFAVIDEQKQLLPYFITISNIISSDPQRVIAGNQRVMRARLADAQFFYHLDLQHSLVSRLAALDKVTYQKKLGTLLGKSQRIAKLTSYLAQAIDFDQPAAERAGLLSKADLMSTMVGEFPELQGVMGYYYAQRDGEAETVALAIRDHYKPRFAGDDLPETTLGCLLAIADRIDSIIGLFAIHQPPSGEKDPYGLRRAALGVLRILIEKQFPLDLYSILTQAKNHYDIPLDNEAAVPQAFDFMMERLRAWYADRAIDSEVFTAVLARRPTMPLDFHQRLLAVKAFQALPEAKALAAANKRVGNILKDQSGEWLNHPFNPNLVESAAEQNLLTALETKTKELEPLFYSCKYTEALASLAELRTPIDAFFDQVMVMVEDTALRNNRLALLNQLRNLFLQVADISLLAT